MKEARRPWARVVLCGDGEILGGVAERLKSVGVTSSFVAAVPDAGEAGDEDVVVFGVPCSGLPTLSTEVARLSSRSSAGMIAVMEAGCSAASWLEVSRLVPVVMEAGASEEELLGRLAWAREARRLVDIAGVRAEKLELTRESLEQISMIDTRTGLYNRRFLLVSLEDAVAASRRYGRPLSLCVFRIANHAELERSLGSDGLSALYEQVADVFSLTLRGADIEAWIGRDSFAVMLPETALAGAERVAERIREQLAQLASERGQALDVVSGTVEVDAETADGSAMMRRAEARVGAPER